MKVKTRTILVAPFLLVAYLLWASGRRFSFQNLLSDHILALLEPLAPDSSLALKCSSYFHTIENRAGAGPSTSRFLSLEKIRNHIDHLRVYLRCFVENDIVDEKEERFSRQLLPMFSQKVPLMSERGGWSSMEDHPGSFWRNYLRLAHGKGIVVSLGESDAANAARLVNVLKAVGNELPIQFIHEKALSADAKHLIFNASLAQDSVFLQKISFIDVRPAIEKGFGAAFKGYSNKWFAALFTTFEHMILMDADVVPFVKPSELFETDEYLAKGAFFFRDRELLEAISTSKFAFLRSLLPESLHFNFLVDPEMLNNNFFNYHAKHVMESGMVLMHRPSHISGLLISLSLQYWHKTGKIMYGDKDLFWLGQLISGNLRFHFNENAAAAIGLLENGLLCSAQLGHLDKNFKLLWTNGGLLLCKRNTWLFDFFRRLFLRAKFQNSIGKMKAAYSSGITISQCVLPASIKQLNGEKSSNLRCNFNKNYSYGCGGIFYCAKLEDGGRVVEFSAEEKKWYNWIVLVWSGETNNAQGING